MAAACTITNRFVAREAGVKVYTFAWTSASDGTVTASTTQRVSGSIERIVFDPGTPAPTAAYVVQLLDENGLDVLAGQGAVGIALSATVTTHVKPGITITNTTTTSIAPLVIDDVLTLSITAAGDTKNGSVLVYLRTMGR